MPTSTVQGLRVHHDDVGEGSLWIYLPDPLPPWRSSPLGSGRRWWVPDLPGLGRSDKPMDGLGFPDQVEVLAGWLAAVATGRRPVAVAAGLAGPILFAALGRTAVVPRARVWVDGSVDPDLRLPVWRRTWTRLQIHHARLRPRTHPLLWARGASATLRRLSDLDGWPTVCTEARCAHLARRVPTTVVIRPRNRDLPRGEGRRLLQSLPGATGIHPTGSPWSSLPLGPFDES